MKPDSKGIAEELVRVSNEVAQLTAVGEYQAAAKGRGIMLSLVLAYDEAKEQAATIEYYLAHDIHPPALQLVR